MDFRAVFRLDSTGVDPAIEVRMVGVVDGDAVFLPQQATGQKRFGRRESSLSAASAKARLRCSIGLSLYSVFIYRFLGGRLPAYHPARIAGIGNDIVAIPEQPFGLPAGPGVELRAVDVAILRHSMHYLPIQSGVYLGKTGTQRGWIFPLVGKAGQVALFSDFEQLHDIAVRLREVQVVLPDKRTKATGIDPQRLALQQPVSVQDAGIEVCLFPPDEGAAQRREHPVLPTGQLPERVVAPKTISLHVSERLPVGFEVMVGNVLQIFLHIQLSETRSVEQQDAASGTQRLHRRTGKRVLFLFLTVGESCVDDFLTRMNALCSIA